jgi:archaellin
MEIKGSVFAYGNTTSGNVTAVSFVLTNALQGQAIDLSPNNATGARHVTIISYTDNNQYVPDMPWNVAWIGRNTNTNGSNLLEQDNQAVITVDLSHLTTSPTIYSTFTIEVKPVTGAALVINRTLPARIDPVMNLD